MSLENDAVRHRLIIEEKRGWTEKIVPLASPPRPEMAGVVFGLPKMRKTWLLVIQDKVNAMWLSKKYTITCTFSTKLSVCDEADNPIAAQRVVLGI